MVKVIIVTGSVGTGKTFVSKKLAKKNKAKYVDVNKIIKNYKLSEGYDKKRKCKVVDVKKLNKVLIKMIKDSQEDLVIDSHLSHFLPHKYVDLCIVTKCSIKKLKSRLKKRHYPKSKIKENVDVELFDVCLNEAKELIALGSPTDMFTTLKKIFPKFVEKRIKKKIPVRTIVPDSPTARERKRLGPKQLRTVKLISKKYNHHTLTFVWDKKIAMFSLKKELVALVIESEELAQSQIAMFNFMWETGEFIEPE